MTPATVKSGQSHNSYILTHRMYRLLTSSLLPHFVPKSFSSEASEAATPSAFRSGPSHNYYILTQRMFRLLTSCPLPPLCLEGLLFRNIGDGDPCRRPERPVLQLLHSHLQNVSTLDISSPPPLCLKELLFRSINGATPSAVKSGQSQNSYILTHRMFRLSTSRPLHLFVSKSFSFAASVATTHAAVKRG